MPSDLGRHPPRAIDAVGTPDQREGGTSAALASARRARPGPRLSARSLYNLALIGAGVAMVSALMGGHFVLGMVFFGLLFLMVRLARLGD